MYALNLPWTLAYPTFRLPSPSCNSQHIPWPVGLNIPTLTSQPFQDWESDTPNSEPLDCLGWKVWGPTPLHFPPHSLPLRTYSVSSLMMEDSWCCPTRTISGTR